MVEMTPIPDADGESRGVVLEGPVGSRLLERFRVFRYELRRWQDGHIPDAAWAVASPQRLSDDQRLARGLLDMVPSVPALVWGRDELRAGEMWNSNSVISWLLARSGVPSEAIGPPVGGRAPGWRAGLVAAHPRQRGEALQRGPGPSTSPRTRWMRGQEMRRGTSAVKHGNPADFLRIGVLGGARLRSRRGC